MTVGSHLLVNQAFFGCLMSVLRESNLEDAWRSGKCVSVRHVGKCGWNIGTSGRRLEDSLIDLASLFF